MRGDDVSVSVLADSTSIRMSELLRQNQADFERRYRAPAQELEARLAARSGNRLAGVAPSAALEEHLRACEERIETILHPHSRLFWVHLSRRLPPVPWRGANERETNLYRLVFSLAVLKHGRPYAEHEDMTRDENGTIVPRALTHEDHLAIYQVEQLAYSFNLAAASYRRTAKGATLRSPCGSPAEAWFRDARLTDAYNTLIVADLNVFQRPWAEAAPKQFELGIDPFGSRPNYVLGTIDIKAFEVLAGAYEEEVRDLVGLTSDELLGFLWALSSRHFLVMLCDRPVAYQFLQRAYVLTAEGDPFERTVAELSDFYQQWLREARGKQIEEAAAIDLIRRAFDALAYTDEELASIDLWSKTPRKLILRAGEYTLWDYSSIVDYLCTLVEQIGPLSSVVVRQR